VGITINGTVVLRINSTSDDKTQTLTVRARARSASIAAGTFKSVCQWLANFAPVGTQLFWIEGTLAMEITASQLSIYASAT